MNDYFKPAGDLTVEEEKRNESSQNSRLIISNSLVNQNDSTLINTVPTNRQDSNYYQTAGDMINEPINTTTTDNIENKQDNKSINSNISVEQINAYLSTIVSGEKYPDECELGMLCSEASMIINLDQLIEMASDDSYNIISAECLNPDMISVRYQQYFKSNMKSL